MIINGLKPEEVVVILRKASRIVNTVASANDLEGAAFVQLAQALVAAPQPIDELTVGQFVDIIRRARQDYDEDLIDLGLAVKRPAWLPHPRELAGN